MAASYTLLGLVPPGAAAAETPHWDVNTSLLHYSESGRIGVFEPQVNLRKTFAEKREFNLLLLVDTISGSTPVGTLPHNPGTNPITLTSPSGRSLAGSTGGVIPMTRYRDTRYGLDGAWKQPLGPVLVTVGAAASGQSDYTSYGGDLSLATDVNDKNTTIVLGISPEFDIATPHGGVPDPYAPVRVAVAESRTKQVMSVLTGVTQVIDRRTLMQWNYVLTNETGYLTDPYKQLSLMHPVTGTPLSNVYEKRPDTRNSHSLFWLTKWNFLDNHILSASYRYFWDTWGIRAHTLDATDRWQFSEKAYIEPHLRIYRQSRANFYNIGLISGGQFPGAASADYRLAAFDAYTIGLRGGWTTADGSTFALRVEYYTQTGESHPDTAIGIQRNFNLFPTLHATIFQIQYGFDPARLREALSPRS